MKALRIILYTIQSLFFLFGILLMAFLVAVIMEGILGLSLHKAIMTTVLIVIACGLLAYEYRDIDLLEKMMD